ncbi:O-antigen ligase family protein [Massilimicrobiota sp. An134]|uniref:O-antigen ligase family protein n=1 Tax=Massilimicrobiota sp. An134 TaxID=1965557 RepID=UPI000B3854BC|nr:O-antigen ligase family protein [Massilimicrobiota sp. An134]OUQ30347.1 hypothetical protein B5E79_03600 [Massilimicrobiota sp. An134]
MINVKKGIAYKIHFIFLVLIFISLDSAFFNIPYAHILRWIYPVFLMLLILKKTKKILYPKGSLWVAIAVMFIVSSLYSINVSYSFGRVYSYLIMTLFFFMFYRYQSNNHTLINIPYYLGKGFIVYEVANFISTIIGGGVRATGITGNANSLGIWSNVAFIFSVYYIKKEKNLKIKYLYVAIALMSVYTAIASGSRTYTICILLNISIFFIVMFQSKIKYLVLIAVILFICIDITSVLDLLYHLPGVERLIEQGGSRGAIWEAGISLWKQKPIFGWGYGVNQELNSIEYLGYIPGYTDYGFSFHNSYLSTIIEIGIVGLFIVLMHYVLIMLKGLKNYIKTKNITIFTVIWICINMFFCFIGSSAMTSLGSTEGFLFWGLLMWLYVYVYYGDSLGENI